MSRKPERPATSDNAGESIESEEIFELVEQGDEDGWDDLPPLPGKGGLRATRPTMSPPPLPGKSKRTPKASDGNLSPVRRGVQLTGPSWKSATLTGLGTFAVVTTLTYTLLSSVMGSHHTEAPQTASTSQAEVDARSDTDPEGETGITDESTASQQGQLSPSLPESPEGYPEPTDQPTGETTDDPVEQLASADSSLPASDIEKSASESPTEKSSEPEKEGEKPDDTGSASASGDVTSNDTGRLIASALSLVKADQRNEAIPYLKRASNVSPSDPRPDFYLGFLYLGSGAPDPKEAREKITSAEMHFNKAFNRTADRSPERAATANNLAIVELKLRKYGAARNYFGTALKNSPDSPLISHNVARLLSQLDTFDIKADEVKKIQALNVPVAALQPSTGWLYLPMDQHQETQEQCLTFIPRHTFEDISCSSCNGCARLVCIPCRGTGKVGVLTTAGEKRDIGFGMTASSTSMGTTNVACRNCGGSGRVDCGACSDGRDSKIRK